jgi:hypothetical protein
MIITTGCFWDDSKGVIRMGERFFRHIRLFPCWVSLFTILALIQPSPATGQIESTFIAPVLVSPGSFEITTAQNFPPLGIPTFAWKPVSEAVVYYLQINSDPSFTLPNLLEIHTTNLQFTPTEADALPDGTYYWRVRVEEPLPGSIFSEAYQFIKSWAIPQNAPLLIAPNDNAYLAFFDAPTFSWEAVIGAARYRFQVSSSPDNFGTPIYQQDTAALAHQPQNKFPNGRYYWRVLPLDPVGYTGMPSATRSFTLAFGSSTLDQIPALLTPEQDATLLFTPTFSWTAIPGAQSYRLEYNSGPVCSFTNATVIETSQTSYSPTSNFPDQTMYCWRVRAQSVVSIGGWSETGKFMRQWNLESHLLTPTFADPYARAPVFSWTPITGAAYYQVESTDTSQLDRVDFQAATANPFWVSPIELLPDHYTWQITPFDSDDHPGITSQAFTFQNPLTATIPALVYPFYYFLPNDPGYTGNIPLNPVEDRTAAFPVFIWQRVFYPSPYGGLLARTYRLQVSSDPYFFHIVWELDTANTAATPTLETYFYPTPGQDYFWRVCPLDLVLPTCQVNPANGDEWWSETRIAHFDASLGLPLSDGDAPQLLRPVHGHEQVEGTPLLEWNPLAGASHYQVQISRDPNFATLEQEANPMYPLYASPVSLAQRNLNQTDYGTFYWRVRGVVDGSLTNWSDIRRFQIASQSEWRRIRVLGNERNKLLVGSDPTGDTSKNFDLSTLYISQSNLAWYFGFNASSDDVIDMTYVIFIDTDHLDGSGGITPPERPYVVSTIAAHRPEYILYIDQIDGQITAQNTHIYTWTGSGWSTWQTLSAAGGSLIYTAGDPGYLELELPDSAIGGNRAPDSISAMVVSINTSGFVLDSVPSDPNVPGSAVLSRFTSASDRMNLIYPPNNPDATAGAIPTLIPLFWDWPTGSDPSTIDPAPATPFAGAQFQIALDPQFSILLVDHIYTSNARYVGTPAAAVTNDLIGDGTYYWRVRPRYLNAGEYFGAWSAPFSFTRSGFSAHNLDTSTEFATPEFTWDMVEGAAQYQLQISAQFDFDPITMDITTPVNAYTPLESLAPGTYYWRIGALREGVSQPVWSSTEAYTLTLPSPIGLIPNDPVQPVGTVPTMCWQPVIVFSNTIPIASAWKYRLQVSTRADFLTLTDSVDTEMHCWTPLSWYPQGAYYWRVAMIDPSGHIGGYSAPAVFIVQYPTPILISPISGWLSQTPGFTWTVVAGAAYYRLDISNSADFYPLSDSTITANTQYTPLFSYPLEQVYYWRVGAYNANGYPGAFVSTHFAIGSPRIWLPMMRK